MDAHTEAWHRSKLTKALAADPGVQSQRFEDNFAAGIPDVFVSKGPSAFWIETKHHVATKFGVILPASSLTGSQYAWLRRMNNNPIPCGVLVFMETGWIFCPIERVHDVLQRFPGHYYADLIRPGCPRSFQDLLDCYNDVLASKEITEKMA